MKKQTAMLVVALVVLGLLGGAYVWLKNKSEALPQEQEQEKQEVQWQTVFEETAQVTEISVTKPEASYGFVKEQDAWVMKNVPGARLKQANVDALALCASIVRASDAFLPTEELSGYGLHQPILMEASFANGSSLKIQLGDSLASGGGYYALVNDQSDIYVLDAEIGDMLWHNAIYYRETVMMNVSQNSFQSMDVFMDGGKRFSVEPIPENEKGIRFSMWKIVSPVHVNVDDTAFTKKVIGALNPIAASDFIDHPGDMKNYGIGEKYVEASDGKTTVRIYFGDRTEKGVYVWDGISPYLAIVKNFPFDTLDYRDVMDMHVMLEFMEDVESIQVEYPDAIYNLTAKDGGYFLDNAPIDDSVYKNLYQKIASLKYSDGPTDETDFSERKLSITMTMKDGSTRYAHFYDDSAMKYYVETEGLSGCLIEKKIVDNFEGMLMQAKQK